MIESVLLRQIGCRGVVLLALIAGKFADKSGRLKIFIILVEDVNTLLKDVFQIIENFAPDQKQSAGKWLQKFTEELKNDKNEPNLLIIKTWISKLK